MSTTQGGFDDDDRALETVIKLIQAEPVAGVPTATGVDEAASSAPSRSLDAPGAVATLEGSAVVRASNEKGKAPRSWVGIARAGAHKRGVSGKGRR